MTQRPDDTRLHDWLDETVGPTPDPVEGTQQVMSQVEETSQVGRWLPFPVLHRKAKVKPPRANHTTEYQPSPISDTNGHTPTVIGRTQTMLSPVKAITAGALVFAIGGVLLIAQPFDQQGSVPGAEEGAELADPVEVTITSTEVPGGDPGTCTTHAGDYERCTGTTWSHQWSATDPRLSGTATHHVNEVSTGVIFEAYAIEVVNDKGAWVGTGRHASSPVDATVLTLTGEGEYEGFSAFVFEDTSGSEEEAFKTAVIIEGELPPFPELPSAE
jgi:hypothetical protein